MGFDSSGEVAGLVIRVKVGGFIINESSGANVISDQYNKC